MTISNVGSLRTQAGGKLGNVQDGGGGAFWKDMQSAARAAGRREASPAAEQARMDAQKDAADEAAEAAGMFAAEAEPEREAAAEEKPLTTADETGTEDETLLDAQASAAAILLAPLQITVLGAAQSAANGAEAVMETAAASPEGMEQPLKNPADAQTLFNALTDASADQAGQADESGILTQTREDATFAERILGEIRQAVVSNEAERTGRAAENETPEQDVLALTQREEGQGAPHSGALREYDIDIDLNAHTAKTYAAPGQEENAQSFSGGEKSEAQEKKTLEQNVPQPAQEGTGFAAQQTERGAALPVETEAEAVAPKARQAAFFEGLLESVETAVNERQSELFVQLKPAVLGGLAIRLVMTEEGLSAQVRSSNQQLQAMMSAEMTQLSEALREKGIQVVQMEVLYDQNTMASNPQLSQGQNGFQGGGQDGRAPRRRILTAEDLSMRPYGQFYETVTADMMAVDEPVLGVEYSA